MAWQGLLQEYKDLLPVNDKTPMLTLNEGNTPLVKLDNLSKKYGVEAYAKIEGANQQGHLKTVGW